MDRFIDVQRNRADQLDLYLKSNMDRFIAVSQFKFLQFRMI